MKAACMEIVSVKDRLRDAGLASLLAYSMYRPTSEQLKSFADSASSDPDVFACACYRDQVPRGVLMLRRIDGDAVLQHIAVDPAHRKQGIASALLSFAKGALAPRRMIAETDDDAVAFYRKAGFSVESLGEQYPGVVRYRCTLLCG